MTNHKSSVTAMAVACLIAACGGAGGNGSDATTSTTLGNTSPTPLSP